MSGNAVGIHGRRVMSCATSKLRCAVSRRKHSSDVAWRSISRGLRPFACGVPRSWLAGNARSQASAPGRTLALRCDRMATPWLPCCISAAGAGTRRRAALLLLAALLPRRVRPLPACTSMCRPGRPASRVCFSRSTALSQSSPTRCGPGQSSTAVASRLERVPHQQAGHSPNPAGCALSPCF